jgi:DtxR family Mn-dependent transcriptional regulator
MRTFCGLTTDGMLEYLSAIYRLGETPDRNHANRVTTTAIAEVMCVSLPAASSMLKRLEDSGFVGRSNVDGITLTEQGRLAALQLLRRHRLLEVFLIQVMGFTWDQVEAEANRLEHAVSSAFEERMDALCGYPTHCPHGDPIPCVDGKMPEETLVAVPQLQPGDEGMLRRVASRDASVLRYLSSLKLMPGSHVRVREIAPFNGPITLEITPRLTASATDHRQNGNAANRSAASNHDEHMGVQMLGTELADQLFVVRRADLHRPFHTATQPAGAAAEISSEMASRHTSA